MHHRLWLVMGLSVTFALACGGLSPEEIAAQEQAAKDQLVKDGPAKFVQGRLNEEICSGTSVNLTFGLRGHEEAVTPFALEPIAYTRWLDGGLGDGNNGKVVDLKAGDVDWYYALEVYCSDRAVCADTACTLDLGDSVMQIEHRLVNDEARIVAAFKGDALGGDKAGLASARSAWLAEVGKRHPVAGGAPAEPPPADDGGDEVATKPDPRPRGGAGGGGARGGGGGGAGKGRKGGR
jgi:hypothetical protein